ncbi:hypothetical protein [Mesorhizobium sp.]|uniref:hypothetical protein n=1 Tax=Mesorhizobium sp. TaxID=1871066 RepID=UPI000FE6700B|nr:hypothetical protein [Mesorhizobium sp.]RWP80459.1 MAG: hypothetical protein EOR10_08420 [Mesorhizobium sp.]
MAQDMLAITLGFRAPKKLSKHPIFGADKRKHIVNQMMDAMADWRLSPFEFEGACRAGLRSALCLDGNSWQRADDEAASIIETCLRGHRRPTWLQGQPEGADRENCLGCGQLLDTSERQLRRVSYCSEMCQASARVRREEGDRFNRAQACQKAFKAVTRRHRPEQLCTHCGTAFRPGDESAGFCSAACARYARHAKLDKRECATCRAPFQPLARKKAGRFCSLPCYHVSTSGQPAATKATLAPRICDHCSETFQRARPKAKFCSAKCRNRAAYERSKTP